MIYGTGKGKIPYTPPFQTVNTVSTRVVQYEGE